MKKALITGITGQDGSYLADFLLDKSYEVHGIIRRNSQDEYGKNIQHILNRVTLHYCDLMDMIGMYNLINKIMPNEIYNLAAQSQVQVSFDSPEYTANVNAFGPLRILDSIRGIKEKKPNHEIRFYQASTSEMFGDVREMPQTEKTPFWPRSPYAIAKVFAHYTTINYYEAYNIYACSGILFNHESPRRGKTFVTRKIVKGIKDVLSGKIEYLELGNLNSLRDWGHAKDYVKAMWLMLQQEKPKTYVISSGKQYSIKYFVEQVCKYHNISIEWKGQDLNEIGIDTNTGNSIIKVNPKWFRPAEVETLLGDSSLAEKELGWKREYDINALIKDMCESEDKNDL